MIYANIKEETIWAYMGKNRNYFKINVIIIKICKLSLIMKNLKLFVVGFFIMFISACQLDEKKPKEFDFGTDEFNTLEALGLSISENDAAKKFSNSSTGIVEIDNITIDFTCDEYLKFQTSDKDFILYSDGIPIINYPGINYDDSDVMNLDTIRTVGQLAMIYSGFSKNKPSFIQGYSNLFLPTKDADYIYPTIEYILGQVCIQDDCSSQTRKAVLKMAIEKQTYKYGEYEKSYHARKTGIFLMASILVKEGYQNFLEVVQNDSDLQNALNMNIDNSKIDKKFSNSVSQYAYNYLIDK